MNVFRFTAVLFVFLILPYFTSLAISADFYRWKDEQGTLHFSDSLANVPPQYRDQVRTGDFNKKKQSPVPLESLPERLDDNPEASLEKGNEALKQYKVAYQDREGSARRVIIDVTFNDRVTVPVLFDTGAFETILFPDLAIKLNFLDPDQPKLLVRAAGIGGSVPAFRTVIDSMHVGEMRSNFVPVTVLFEGFSEAYEGIVGLDFISDYSVRIDPKEKVVVFEEVLHGEQLYGGRNEDWWRTYFIEFESNSAEWKRWRNHLEKLLERNSTMFSSIKTEVVSQKEYADAFYKESQRLLSKLHHYASKHSVPIHWRRKRN